MAKIESTFEEDVSLICDKDVKPPSLAFLNHWYRKKRL